MRFGIMLVMVALCWLLAKYTRQSAELFANAPARKSTPIGESLVPQTQVLLDAWVGFADKGILSPSERRAAFLELEHSFDPRALERRRARRTLPGLFDDHDLPLHSAYLEGVAATGARLRVRSRWLNGVTVLGTRDQLAAIDDLPFVAEVSDVHLHVPKGERRARIPQDPDLVRAPRDDSLGTYGWSAPQIRQLNLEPLHEAGFRGAGVRIGVVDTGFLISHSAFSGPGPGVRLRVVAQWDFVDNDSVVAPEPGDSPVQHEHGTLVLGTVGANRPGELVGSAPEAEYVLLKAEDEATEYHLEERWFVAALEFAEAHGCDVITSSVVLYEGYEPHEVDGHTSVMAQGWERAVGNGVLGFQGGGNAGHDDDPSTHGLLTPGGVPGVITVGAADPQGRVARFSSDGFSLEGTVKPELLAWGQGTATVSPYDSSGYTSTAGTSVATPLLAGAAACLLQANPQWSNEDLKEALFRSGGYFRAQGEPDPRFVQGYGIPDLERAAGKGSGRDPESP
jgi:subtilisin family serine protease